MMTELEGLPSKVRESLLGTDDPQFHSFNQDFDNARDLLDHLINDHLYQAPNILIGGIAGVFLYRGQSNAEWSLTPSVFRPGDVLKNFTPQAPGCPVVEAKRKSFHPSSYIGMHVHQELRACHLFMDHAEQIGITTPLDYVNSTLHRTEIFEALSHKEIDWSAPFPDERLWPWLALSQHHGVPTRLLDFTSSPLHALFFAAYGASTFKREVKQCDSSRIAVYCLNRLHLDRLPEVKIVRAKGSIDGYLRAQSATFVLPTQANKFFHLHSRWPSLHEIRNDKYRLDTYIHRLTLPSSESDLVLRLLHRLGFSHNTVFPSLGNAASQFAYLRSLFGPQVDEHFEQTSSA